MTSTHVHGDPVNAKGADMNGTIVVGVDECTGARDALRWAVAEATIRNSEVLAVLVWGFLDRQTNVLEGFNPDYTAADAEAALGRMIDDALPTERASSVRRQIVCDLPARTAPDTAPRRSPALPIEHHLATVDVLDDGDRALVVCVGRPR